MRVENTIIALQLDTLMKELESLKSRVLQLENQLTSESIYRSVRGKAVRNSVEL